MAMLSTELMPHMNAARAYSCNTGSVKLAHMWQIGV